jgi:hypothetical protein
MAAPRCCLLAGEFFVAVSATFRMLYMFVVIEHNTRRLAHVTNECHRRLDPATVAGSRGERRTCGSIRFGIFRNSFMTSAFRCRMLSVVDRSRSAIKIGVTRPRERCQAPRRFDQSLGSRGIAISHASPKTKSLVTARRQCLEWLISLSEAHLRGILKC